MNTEETDNKIREGKQEKAFQRGKMYENLTDQNLPENVTQSKKVKNYNNLDVQSKQA